MVLLASAAGLSSPMSSWPGMHSGQKDPFQNPFQNAPGPFIYALPNLTGTCPLSYSDTVLFCSFSGELNAPDPHHHHHHRCCHTSPAVTSCSCHRDPPSAESTGEPPKAPTKGEGEPDTELPSPPLARPSTPPLSPSVENHFDLADDFSSESLTDDGTEPRKQEEEPQANSGLSTTSTQSNSVVSSPTESDFLDGPKKEGEDVKMEGRRSELSASTQSNSLPVSSPTRSDCLDGPKKEGEAKKTRGQRKRRSRRQAKSEHGVPPRFMGLSGIHYGLWTQYVQLQPPLYPPPPVSPAMNHHRAWSFAGYPYPGQHYGFVVPPNSPAHQFWNPKVPPIGGFVGVPTQC